MSEIVGIKSLISKLSSLDLESAVEQTIRKNIKETVQAQAKELCPVDTGDLRGSIKEEVKVSGSEVAGVVSTNSDHATYIEFGTGKVGENTPVADKYPGDLVYKQDKWKGNIPDVGWRWIAGQPAQPYLYPALKNNEDKIIENICSDLKAEIRKVSKND